MHEKKPSRKYSKEEILESIGLIESLVSDSSQLMNLSEKERITLMKAAGHLAHPDRDEIRKRRKDIKFTKRQRVVKLERSVRARTGIRQAREAAIFSAPKQITDAKAATDPRFSELKSPRNCYVCKAEYKRLHFFYDSMCPACADFNYKKGSKPRHLTARSL